MDSGQAGEQVLGEHDIDLVTVVAEDLRYLARPTQDQPTRTDVRLIATVLRRLLLHGDYGRAWRLMGNTGEPSLRARDPEPMMRSVPNPMWIHYVYAGGYSFGGANHQGLGMVVVPASEQAGREAFGVNSWDDIQLHHSVTRTYNLSAYLGSTCIQIATNKIKRGELLRYVANKLGGAHLDRKRSKARDQELSVLLDRGQLCVAGLPGPYFEVLTMAWDLARSDHAHQLVQAVMERFPPEMDEPDRVYLREGFDGGWTWLTMEPTRVPDVSTKPA